VTTRRLGGPFWRFWTSATLSALGDGFTLVALPLLAARLTHDPSRIALVLGAEYTAWLLFGLVSGALADRWERRRIMAVTDFVRIGLFAVLAVLVAADRASVTLLVVFAFVAGMLSILNENSASALLPTIVGRDQLEPANAWLQAGLVVPSTFVGPAVGGLLFVAAPSLPFTVDAISYLVSAVLVLSIRTSRPSAPETPIAGLLGQMGEGLRWLWSSQVLRVLCLLLAVVNGTFAAVEGILVLYAQEVLGLSERGYGLLLSVMALGTVAGSALAQIANRTFGPAKIVPLLMLTQGVSMLAVAATGSLTVAVGGFFVGGLASGLWNIATISLRQRIVPDRLLGRVTSAYRMVGLGAMPLGAILGGALARGFGLTSTLAVSGVLSLLSTVVALCWFTAGDVASALGGSDRVAGATPDGRTS
jgi:MFS family permease